MILDIPLHGRRLFFSHECARLSFTAKGGSVDYAKKYETQGKDKAEKLKKEGESRVFELLCLSPAAARLLFSEIQEVESSSLLVAAGHRSGMDGSSFFFAPQQQPKGLAAGMEATWTVEEDPSAS